MKYLARLISVCAMIFVMMFLASSTSLAFNPIDEACDGSAASSSSSVCQDNATVNPEQLVDKNEGLVNRIANIIALVGGILAVIFIMINGLTIMTSTGDSTKINKARDGLIYAAIGVVVIILSRIIIGLILRYL